MAIPYWQPEEPLLELKTRLRLIELLDNLPLDGCLAQTRVRAIPIFMLSYVPPDADNPGVGTPGNPGTIAFAPGGGVGGVGGAGGAGGWGGATDVDIDKPTPIPGLAVGVEVSEITDAANTVDFAVRLADAMAEAMTKRYDDKLPIGLCFDQAFSASAFGVQLPWTAPVGVELYKLEGINPFLIVDLAKSIVGDTSATHATLWFQLHGAPRPGDRYVVEIVDVAPPGRDRFGETYLDPHMSGGAVGGTVAPPPLSHPGAVGIDPGGGGAFAGDLSAPPRGEAIDPGAGLEVDADIDLDLSPMRQRLTLDPSRAMTGVSIFRNLRPGALYGYLLKVRMSDGRERVLTQGRFRTFLADPKSMNIAFASCHKPTDEHSLNRWKALSRRTDQDVLFLTGDQIYADHIDSIYPRIDNWRDRYIHRYNQLFAYQPMRDVLRTRPTYMILDDHEIVDDWGVSQVDERLEPGLEAYRIFQHAHNPGGYSAPHFDYSFRRGRAAFYVIDNRSGRGAPAGYPVLGKAQHERLLAWARSSEVADADLVFVVVPVPPGILPIAAIEEFASRAKLLAPVTGAVAGAVAGAILGGIGGFIVGGPAGAMVGATMFAELGGTAGFIGGVGAAFYYEHLEDTITEPDVRDAWTYDKNLPDLVRLMDVLFDVAIDAQTPNGAAGPKPKGVFVLSGDYHFGAVHRLISKRRRHGVNSTMMQITSSPISTSPANNAIMEDIIKLTAEGIFALDREYYVSKFLGRTMQLNFGRVAFNHVGPGRRYYIQIFVEGETETLAHFYELDLDKRPVVMRDMMGDVLGARGRISSLRVHDPDTGYGPSGDRIEGEVVIQLETMPGRAFGFELKRNGKWAAHKAMLDLLRDAFNHGRTIAIDYKRTGLTNGTLIRASVIAG